MQRNQTEITEFILLGFGGLSDVQLFLFLLFLLLYISTMAANILSVLLIVVDQHLHTPMYFFLGNLSCLEMLYSSTIQPNMLAGLLTGDKAISFTGCITQLYFFVKDFRLSRPASLGFVEYFGLKCRVLLEKLFLPDVSFSAVENIFSGEAAGADALTFMAAVHPMFRSPQLRTKHLEGKVFPVEHGTLTRNTLQTLYFFGFLVGTECYLLSVMSYDRYLAICKPLQYATRMNSQMCFQLAACSWISGHIVTLLHLSVMLQLAYCGPNEIDHYFCDSVLLMKLSCSDSSLVELMIFILAMIVTLPPFLLTLMSYTYIITTVLGIPSTAGRQKAFSTCSSHLIVVSTFYGALMIVYVFPEAEALRNLKKVFSLLYTILTPIANPLIYSLRNKEVKDAMGKILRRLLVS